LLISQEYSGMSEVLQLQLHEAGFARIQRFLGSWIAELSSTSEVLQLQLQCRALRLVSPTSFTNITNFAQAANRLKHGESAAAFCDA
jgi:hypothetical protein